MVAVVALSSVRSPRVDRVVIIHGLSLTDVDLHLSESGLVLCP